MDFEYIKSNILEIFIIYSIYSYIILYIINIFLIDKDIRFLDDSKIVYLIWRKYESYIHAYIMKMMNLYI